MTSHPVRLLVVVLTATLLFGACGGDDNSSSTTMAPPSGLDADSDDDEEPEPAEATVTSPPGASDADRGAYIAALADEFADQVGDDMGLDEDSGVCAAEGLVEVVGVDHLVTAGITPEQFAVADSFAELDIVLADSEVERLSEALDTCIDFRTLWASTAPADYACLIDGVGERVLARSLAVEWATGTASDVTMQLFESAAPACAEQIFLGEGVAQGDITEQDASCVADVLADEVAVRILLAAQTSNGPAEEDRVLVESAFAACGVEN